MWNVLTKSQLLAILRGTEEFLEELQECVKEHTKESAKRGKALLKQFHKTLTIAAQETNLSFIVIFRLIFEFCLTLGAIFMQYFVYNTNKKSYYCNVKELSDEEIVCTVPVLDLLDGIWSINVAALIIALTLVIFSIYSCTKRYFSEYQPLFFNELPFGEDIDFSKTIVEWDSHFTKHSYELIAAILSENNSIVTKVYCIRSLAPPDDDDDDDEIEKTKAVCENKDSKIVSEVKFESKSQVKSDPDNEEVLKKYSSTAEYSVVDGSIVKCSQCEGEEGCGLRHRNVPGATPALQDKVLLSVLMLAGFILFYFI